MSMLRNRKGQRGFTLVEVLVALAIMTVLGVGIATSIFQLFTINTRSNDAMLVIRQVQNLGHWLNRDVQMSETTTMGVGGTFPLIMVWDYRGLSEAGYVGEKHQITYTYNAIAKTITRQDVLYDASNTPQAPSTIIVAEYVQSATFDSNILVVTAVKGSQSETRNYEITFRVTA
ncbi:PulJ/GspJ family protein [Dehalogenimonas alkenigignens]|uniref:PulJ/GspJ family protein n=1 Tax=Dehalogenimonas alkenigignens TaxID=1217799 RepID=UPI000D564927|nr:type II secretion system protein [Dehalogenimonas alkenigignens]PVV84400.1 hypothetical protein DD509_03660 [Dehalogenimonas alkenigignens]